MPASPTVLIGTMHSGEGDFERCRQSVAAQTCPCEQYVVENLPEPEAHAALYRRFKDSGADYLIKLDADMVLKTPDDAATIIARIRGTPLLKVSHHVDDFFTGRPILGIHCYSRAVEFDWAAFQRADLYADRRNSVLALPPAERPRVWNIYDDAVAWHCFWSTDLQAFHYGYHRWLKDQFDICARVLERHRARPSDSRLEMACLGMITAAHAPNRAAASYGPELHALYDNARLRPPLQGPAAALEQLLTSRSAAA